LKKFLRGRGKILFVESKQHPSLFFKIILLSLILSLCLRVMTMIPTIDFDCDFLRWEAIINVEDIQSKLRNSIQSYSNEGVIKPTF